MNAPHTTPPATLHGLGNAVENAIIGHKGRYTPQPGESAYLPPHVREVVAQIVSRCGVAGDGNRVYAAKLVRYMLGKDGAPVPPRTLSAVEQAWMNTRLSELLDQRRSDLPPLRDDRLTGLDA